MKTAEPKIIYLQIGEDADVEDMKAEDYETNAITWCWDKIFNNDVKYISAKELISKIDEMYQDVNYMYSDKEVLERTGYNKALTELKQWIKEK